MITRPVSRPVAARDDPLGPTIHALDVRVHIPFTVRDTRSVRQLPPATLEDPAQRNGYRRRDLDTRIGTIDVAIPKLRTGTYSRSGCWSAANARRPR